MSDYPTRDDLRETVAQAVADWRRELGLELKSFKNEMRILLVVSVVVLKFDVPDQVTVGAVLSAFLWKPLLGLISRH